MNKRKRFSQEFKLEAVRFLEAGIRPASDAPDSVKGRHDFDDRPLEFHPTLVKVVLNFR